MEKKLQDEIILKYPGTFISYQIVEMRSNCFTAEAKSLKEEP